LVYKVFFQFWVFLQNSFYEIKGVSMQNQAGRLKRFKKGLKWYLYKE